MCNAYQPSEEADSCREFERGDRTDRKEVGNKSLRAMLKYVIYPNWRSSKKIKRADTA